MLIIIIITVISIIISHLKKRLAHCRQSFKNLLKAVMLV